MRYIYAALLLLISSVSTAQTDVSWDFGASLPGSATASTGLPITNLTVSAITSGNNNGAATLLTTTSASSGYTSASGNVNAGAAAGIGALSTAAGGSAYFEFVLTPNTGSTVSLSAVNFGTRATSTGPVSYSIKTSANSFGADAATGTIANNSTWVLKTNTTNVTSASGTPLTVRIYGYDGAGSPSAGTTNWRIDDLKITVTVNTSGPDVTPPTVTTLTPTNTATNVNINTALTILFSEPIQKGTGNIVIKKLSDNSVIQTINVTTAAVTITGSTASVSINPLLASTGYYIEIGTTVFKDLANNSFVGIAGSTTWNFTTATASGTSTLDVNFNTCAPPASITDGFTQYSVTGPQIWACTTFGRDPAAPAGTAAFPNAVQINGYANGSNVINEDWLISPSLNLTGTNFPLLSFWSRTAFNGAPLKLKVSTNYSGIGDPSLATWTDLAGNFPQQTSNIWTQSQNINLSAYKTNNTYFAFVYYATNDDGARWTIDDVKITNSAVPPPPTLKPNTGEVNFGFVASGTTLVKTISFIGADITAGVSLTATGNFLISKTNGSFTSSISYTQAEANNITKTVYVQFAPTAATVSYTGNLTISTPTVADTIVVLKGNSIDAANTLEVVNWNLEWFGSTSLGPVNDNLQEQNVKTVLQNVGADVYALVEVVSEPRLANIVSQMPGYAYVLSNYGSYTNPNQSGAGPLSESQKLGLVYKTALFPGGLTTQPLLSAGINTAADVTNPAYNWYASGRFPFMVTGTTTLNGITKKIRFVITHAKANTSPTLTSYARRKAGNDSLLTHLNTFYPNDNIIFLGDFNDDLDSTITAGIAPKLSSYKQFTDDTAHFYSPTLALSLAGKKSTVSYNDMIDHVMLSNEMKCSYMPGSAAVLTDVAALIPSYGTTTTDHYPIFTRYLFVGSQTASISYAGSPFCGNAANANVSFAGTTGGVYSSTTGLSINATTGTINVAASNAGTYTITYTLQPIDVCNPLFTTTTTITINSLATAPTSIMANNPIICTLQGGMVNLSVVGGTVGNGVSYKWYTGSCGGTLIGTGVALNNVPVTNTTTFYVRAEAACNNTTCASINIIVAAQPGIVVSANPTAYTNPAEPVVLNTSLSPTDVYTYQWYKYGNLISGATASTYTVTADQANQYSVTATSTSGCKAISSSILVIAKASTQIFISPNPNKGIFNVSVYDGAGLIPAKIRTINIYDAKGARVYSNSYSNPLPYTPMKVDISNLARAQYYIVVQDEKGNDIAKGTVQVL